MHRILTLFLSFHWMSVFAALAVLAGIHGGENFPAVLGAIGIVVPGGSLPTPATSVLCMALAMGFSLVCVLFFWMLVTVVLEKNAESSEADDVARLAFGGAICMLTLVFIGCAAGSVTGLYRSVALELGALVASYLAVCAERRIAATRADDIGATARAMALHAAHESLVSRLMGRPKSKVGR